MHKRSSIGISLDELLKRFSRWYVPNIDGSDNLRFMPKPNTSTRRQNTNTKQSRYRKKMQDEGRCPKCGKPSFPFNECVDHRESQAIKRQLRKSLNAGVIEIIDRGPRGEPIYKRKTHPIPNGHNRRAI